MDFETQSTQIDTSNYRSESVTADSTDSSTSTSSHAPVIYKTSDGWYTIFCNVTRYRNHTNGAIQVQSFQVTNLKLCDYLNETYNYTSNNIRVQIEISNIKNKTDSRIKSVESKYYVQNLAKMSFGWMVIVMISSLVILVIFCDVSKLIRVFIERRKRKLNKSTKKILIIKDTESELLEYRQLFLKRKEKEMILFNKMLNSRHFTQQHRK